MEVAQMTPINVTKYLMKMGDHPPTFLQKLIQYIPKASKRMTSINLKGILEYSAFAKEGK